MSDNEGLSLMDDREEEPRRAAADAEGGGERRRRGRPLLILLVIAGVLVLAVGAVAAYYAATLRGATNNFAREDIPNYPNRPPATSPNPDGSVARNYVLIGTDKGSVSPDDPGRSDALLIAHIPADRSKIYLISIPRDLYAEIPGRGKEKITHAYAYGGMGLSVQSVEKLFDLRIDHAASIDFQSFKDLTTALGGIEVQNANAFQRSVGGVNCDFPEGKITVQGDCALVFARERKKLPDGAISRDANHRAVLQGIMKKTMSPETLINPGRFALVVDTVSQYVTVDQGFTSDQITQQAMDYRDLAGQNNSMVSLEAPITGFGRDPRTNASIALPDEEKMAELAQALRDDKVDEYVSKYPEG
ncbi:LCP family protein required for cell wall assembly [Naumannella cuiyingiana]|uniref:LCP family protein required for cell wall assembly n=1 Tax=Naumannella cuiyingiana TaxID=1347891 RepID=A0A7Z0DA18_9ACTN|nr:LCP family protein [Naumannella cuiyingiana]NYI71458.1 LCP family protein required for cell wall assembly [Naumannella cuiyingiana]